MANVVFSYQVPVYVHVDTETRQVERVVVLDESPVGNIALAEGDDRSLSKAFKIAAEADWPAWEFGY